MSLTASIIAKLSWTDVALARRALDTASALDDANALPPAEFGRGAGARCYAFAVVARYRPGLLWTGLVAAVAIPFFLLVRIFH
jgi:hypothetical protein